jgi:hypothetical protein
MRQLICFQVFLSNSRYVCYTALLTPLGLYVERRQSTPHVFDSIFCPDRSYGKGAAIPGLWEWSMDGVKWIPTSDLKELVSGHPPAGHPTEIRKRVRSVNDAQWNVSQRFRGILFPQGRMSACTCLHAECSPNKADRVGQANESSQPITI